MPRPSSIAAAIPVTPTPIPRLVPPPDLDALERQQFIDLVLAVRPDHFMPSDAPLLAIYCKALVQERVAAGELRAAGYVNGGKPSPWLKVWTDSREAVTTLARMLSLNPQGRSGLVPERQNVSYYEKMNLLEGQRREPQ